MSLSRFERFWLAELQRQHDQHDFARQQQLFHRQEYTDAAPQLELLRRAERLAERRGTTQQLHRWQNMRRLLMVLFGFIAVLLGAGAVQTLLQQPPPISLLFAVAILVVPNLLLLLLWLLLATHSAKPRGISHIAMSLNSWLVRDAAAQQLSDAWLRLVQQQRLLVPLTGAVSHGFWLLIGAASWLTLLLYLSFNNYQFHWATTILDEPQLLMLAQLINYLPELLLGVQLPPIEAQQEPYFANLAGRWLSVCVLFYAVLPRLFAVVLCLLLFAFRVRRMQLDLQAAGHIHAVQELQQTRSAHAPRVVDADTGNSAEHLRFQYAQQGSGELAASLDFESAQAQAASTLTNYFGVLASYADKQRWLSDLQQQPRALVTLRIDCRSTPDRGSMRLLSQTAQYTQKLIVQLVDSPAATYLNQWQQLLDQYGVAYVRVD